MTAPAMSGHDSIDGGTAEGTPGQLLAGLEPGERIVWFGQPVVPPPVGPVGPALALAGAALSLAVALGAWRVVYRDPTGGDGQFSLIGLIAFVLAIALLIGLALVVSRRHRMRQRKKHSLFALSDHRAIVWEPRGAGGPLTIDSVVLSEVQGVRVWSGRDDGTGDLVFEGTGPAAGSDRTGPFAFDGLPEVREAAEQIRAFLVSAAVRRGLERNESK
jgi:hypothetical protein